MLLDEIEKAHSDVFNVLLQVLDDGRLTDSHGRTVDFRNTVLIMTSNIGSQFLSESVLAGDGDSRQTMVSRVIEAVRQHFRPEFLNRLDETIVFNPLGREELRQIVGLQLDRVRQRLEGRGLQVAFAPEVLEYLIDVGFDPVYGARPLKRAIQREVENPLAMKHLKGELSTDRQIVVRLAPDRSALVFD